jgi:hypothetical protein
MVAQLIFGVGGRAEYDLMFEAPVVHPTIKSNVINKMIVLSLVIASISFPCHVI